MKLIPRGYQIEAVEETIKFIEQRKGNPLVLMPTGCHAKGHKILMFDGSVKEIQDIIVGDVLMGDDSTPRYVLQLCRGRQVMRRIVPNKGESFVVNKDHKLSVYVTAQKKNSAFECRKSKVETITVDQYESGTKWYKHLRKLRFVGCEFEKKALTLNPYFLGLMIGDGSILGGINYTSGDEELHDEFMNFSTFYGCSTRRIDHKTTAAIKRHGKFNPLISIFTELGLRGCRAWEKFIPNEYMISDRCDRLELLAGLLDSDGWYGGSDLSYTTTSFQLSEDFKFLVGSLGFGVTARQSESYLNGVRKRDHYTISLSGDFSVIPFRRKRHLDVQKANPRIINKNCLVTGFKVEQLPEDDFYGFTLSGNHLYLDSHFVVHHNTGKALSLSLLLFALDHKYPNWRFRSLIITDSAILVEQNELELRGIWPNADTGINSSDLKRRDTRNRFIFCGIQSIYKNPEAFGKIDIIQIDEAHMLSPKDTTMYQAFISYHKKLNPNLVIVGWTATAYRLGDGLLLDCGIFTGVSFDNTTLEKFNSLIDDGYLSPLIPFKTGLQLDTDNIKTTAGDFNAKDLQEAVDKKEITIAACKELVVGAAGRNHWLGFASGTEHCEHIAEILNSFGVPTVAMHSKMGKEKATQALNAFTSGKVKALVNNNMLVKGFNFKAIDVIFDLKPTKSTNSWVQRLGRGTRPVYMPGYDLTTKDGRLLSIAASGKQNCLVFDFSGNTARLGPINDPVVPTSKKKGDKPGSAPIKVCPVCAAYNHTTVRVCKYCGHEFPEDVKITENASGLELIKVKNDLIKSFDVVQVGYNIHSKLGSPDCLKVTYLCKNSRVFKEYIHIERYGIPLDRATKWWWHYSNGGILPSTTKQALTLVGSLNRPSVIKVNVSTPYKDIVHDFII